ncbi:MAG: hypothetical protein CL678_08725 [Bdellovibrionaceae bacterium]|nr:hypothetical protein [Pseudobdellovibrionaceae bacterium]|tara:strand:+ start:2370 stop:3050 length:681 start_codon:yes stop_codon:yes gene_type:complete
MDDSSSKDFILVQSEVEKLGYQRESTGNSCTFWKKGMSKIEGLVFQWDPSENNLFVNSDSNETLKKNELYYFSLPLLKAHLFFKTTFKKKESKLFIFEPSRKIYKIQRRREIRIPIKTGYKAYIEFDHPLKSERVKVTLIDLSLGGASFEVSKNEILLDVNQILNHVKIEFDGMNICTNATIRHISPLKDNQKVGIQWDSLKKEDSLALSHWVTTGSQRQFEDSFS